MMNQLKFYKYATWILLSLNIAVLAFFLLTKPRPPHLSSSNSFQAKLIETLDLNAQQANTFQSLAQEHNEKMKSIEQQQKNLLLPYFEGLTKAVNEVDRESILLQVQQLEKDKMEVTYQHFEEIKKLLNQDQMSSFKEVMIEFTDRILMNNKKRQHRPKE